MADKKSSSPKGIIHIIGSGRSGSTILDRTLGHHPEAFSIGEIINFRIEYYRNSRCGCGDLIRECEFWNPVLQDMSRELDKTPEDFMLGFHQKMDEDSINSNQEKLRRLKNAFGLFLKLPPRTFSDTTLYDNSATLYKKVFEHSGAAVIIDSSKSIARSLFLSRLLPQYRHVFVHLVRDGRGVLNSYFKKSYELKVTDEKDEVIHKEMDKELEHSPEGIINKWVKGNRLIERIIFVFGLQKQAMMIRFEDFLNAPIDTISRVLEKVSLVYHPSMLNFEFGDNHIVCGNPSRLNAMKLQKEKEKNWAEELRPDLMEKFLASDAPKINEKYGYL